MNTSLIRPLLVLSLSWSILGSPLDSHAVEAAVTQTSTLQDSAEVTAPAPRFRLGAYGDMYASWKDYGINRLSGSAEGNTRTHRATIAIPRFTVALEYAFSSKWHFGAEIEFEGGGTGAAYGLENSENGEYEMEIEKGGEISLEQVHIVRLICREFNVRVGRFVIPVGYNNVCDMPFQYFSAIRPEGEGAILPVSWAATGLELFGTFGHGAGTFSYQAMVTTGLNANGFTRDNWVAEGCQGFFETDNFTSPGYTLSLEWQGIPGFSVAAAGYYCANTGANSDKPQTYKSIGRIPVYIGNLRAAWTNRFITARGSVTYGYLSHSAQVSEANRILVSGKGPYSRTVPVAKNALTYNLEAGVHLRGIDSRIPALTPWVRYEYYSPQQAGAAGQTMDRRFRVSEWQAGVNWQARPGIIVKADYTTRQIGTGRVFGKGTYNSENEFAIGVAYTGWFIRK